MKNIALLLICLLIMAVQAESQINYDSVSGILPLQEGKAMATNSIAAYPNIRLTIDPAESKNPRVEVDVNYVYVVWHDNRDGNWEIYWQKFDRSNGQAITDPIRVTSTSNTSREPAIGIDGIGNSYLVWEEAPNLYGTIYAAKIDPDGLIIVSPMAVSSSHSIHSDIATDAAGNNWITYHRMAPSDQNVYLRKSNNTFVQLCSTNWNKGTIPGMDKQPVVTNTGSYVIVAWRDLKPFFQDAVFARIFNLNCGPLAEVSADGDYRDPAVTGVGNLFFVTFQQAGRIYNLLDQNSVCQINDVNGTGTLPTVATDGDWGWFAWQDSRDGNSEIYSTNAYGCDQFVDERFTENPATSVKPDIAALPSEPGKNWTVWQDNRDGNWEIYLTSTEFVSPSGPPSFVIYDGAGELVMNELCTFYKIENSGQEILLGSSMTNMNGIIEPNPTWFSEGDNIKAEILVHRLATNRTDHDRVNNTAHRIFIDNATIQSNGPLVYEDTYTGQPSQQITLDHTIIKYNLVVAVEWDASPSVLQNLVDAYREVANYLYDVSDGQATLDSVAIIDCAYEKPSLWRRNNGADVKITALNFMKGIAKAGRGFYGNGSPWQCITGEVRMPRVVYASDATDAIELVNSHSIDWTVNAMPDATTGPYFLPGIQSIAHELAHYLLYFGEEYTPLSCATGNVVPNYRFGLMDFPHDNNPNDPNHTSYGEMSSFFDYDVTDASTHTNHGCISGGLSCWELFEEIYEGNVWPPTYLPNSCWPEETFPHTNIERPSERLGQSGPFIGPNHYLGSPDVDYGAEAEIWYIDEGEGSCQFDWYLWYHNLIPKDNIYIELQKTTGDIIPQGFTGANGKLPVLGAKDGDVVRAFWSRNKQVVIAEKTVSCVSRGDSISTELTEIIVNQPMVIEVVPSSESDFAVLAHHDVSFSVLPQLVVTGDDGSAFAETFEIGDSVYTSTDITVDKSGHMLIHAIDDSSHNFFIPLFYNWTVAPYGYYVENAGSYLPGCDLFLDTIASSANAILITEYEYPPIEVGIPEYAKRASSFYSVSVYPNGTALSGTNWLSIMYDIPDSVSSGLSMYRWDTALWSWVLIPGLLDTASNSYLADINEAGTYTLFAPGLDVSGLGRIEPDPMYWFFNNAVSPTSAVVYVGDFDVRTVSEIDPGTIFVNGTITLDSFEVVADHQDFSGSVLACYFDMADFVSQYGLLWDTTIQTYNVSGQFDDGMPFMIEGDITLIGHTSGDLNNDGEVNINDLTLMVGFLFRGADLPCEESVADVNHDGIVNVTDLIWLVSNIFGP